MEIKLDKEALEFLDAFKEGTRRVYFVGLSSFLAFYRESGKGKTLANFLDALETDLQLPRRQRTRVGEKTLREFIKWLEERNLAPKSIRSYVSAVQSFARYYDIPISTRYIDIPPSKPVSDKFPWENADKVAEFLELIRDPEIKTIGVIIFQSGLSISDILNLTYGDIQYEFEREIVPLCFDLSRVKTDVPFMTFIGKWGFSHLKQHISEVKPKPDEPIFNVSRRLIDLHFQKAAKKWVGEWKGFNPARPHSLRAAFKTILSQAGAPYDVVEFWMGHQLPEQIRVYNSRTRDGWREIYANYEKFLTPKEVKSFTDDFKDDPVRNPPKPKAESEPSCSRCGRKGGFYGDPPFWHLPFHTHHIKLNDEIKTVYLCPWCHAEVHREEGDTRAAKLIEGQIRWFFNMVKQYKMKGGNRGESSLPI